MKRRCIRSQVISLSCSKTFLQPLHRVTVLIILAHRIDPRITPNLYELVCQQCGDENEDCIVPCVVDLANHTCVFNCLRVPYIGFGYAVKNRGTFKTIFVMKRGIEVNFFTIIAVPEIPPITSSIGSANHITEMENKILPIIISAYSRAFFFIKSSFLKNL